MSKRDFSNESIFNILFRIVRAIQGRFRGSLLSFLGIFESCGRNLYIASFPRLINSKSLKLGKNIKFGLLARIECYSKSDGTNGNINIGDYCSFGDYIHLGSINRITIGPYSLFGSNILIIDHSHGSPQIDMVAKSKIPPIHREISSKDTIIIGGNVWIADGVVILAGANIGEGCIIAANAIVKGVIPPYTIYG